MSEAARVLQPLEEEVEGESMMVNVSRLDTLLELAGEVIIVSANLESLNRLVQTDSVSKEIAENTKELAYTSTRISSDLHKLVVDVRNVGMRDMFGRFRRLVRDTSRRLGRPVKFELRGQEVSLDKRIAERIFDPIAHQLRNAVAHGIEDEAGRVRLGKSPTGTISLTVEVLNAAICISVQDDGRGIDLAKVRATIVEEGLASQGDVDVMQEKALHAFLFRPGFSTAAKTTGTSGRGVGMNVLEQTIRELDGDISIKSVSGEGTLVRMELPKVSAVNIVDALMVRANGLAFAFPLSNVLSTLAVRPSELISVMGAARSLQYLEKFIPVHDLLGVFGESTVEAETGLNSNGELLILVIEHKGRQGAFVVSEFLNPQKLVITGFDGTLEVPGITGTAILAGRGLGMIVDVPAFLTLALEGRAASLGAQADDGASANGENEPTGGSNNGKSETDSDEVVREPTSERSQPVADLGVADGIGKNFLHELEALVSKLNGSLLELEEKRDRPTTDKVFRLAHSIKGNFTMCSLEAPASLTHDLETILDDARRDESLLSDASFDVLFDGCAHLENVLVALLAGEAPPEPSEQLTEGFVRLGQTRFGAEDSALSSGGLELDATARFTADNRTRCGKLLQVLTLTFDPAEQPVFLLAYLILQRIQTVADVLASSPTLASLQGGVGEGPLEVLIAPRGEPGDLSARLERNLREHFGVTGFKIESPDPGLLR